MVPPTREVTVTLFFRMIMNLREMNSIRTGSGREVKTHQVCLDKSISAAISDVSSGEEKQELDEYLNKNSKGELTTSSIEIQLLKKRKPELLEEDERLLNLSEVSVSTGDSSQGEL